MLPNFQAVQFLGDSGSNGPSQTWPRSWRVLNLSTTKDVFGYSLLLRRFGGFPAMCAKRCIFLRFYRECGRGSKWIPTRKILVKRSYCWQLKEGPFWRAFFGMLGVFTRLLDIACQVEKVHSELKGTSVSPSMPSILLDSARCTLPNQPLLRFLLQWFGMLKKWRMFLNQKLPDSDLCRFRFDIKVQNRQFHR